jgi:hypothetical protein
MLQEHIELVNKLIAGALQASLQGQSIIADKIKHGDRLTAQAKTDDDANLVSLTQALRVSGRDIKVLVESEVVLASDMEPPVIVPDVVGMTTAEAQTALGDLLFSDVRVVTRDRPLDLPDTVFRVIPHAGTSMARSDVVKIFIPETV